MQYFSINTPEGLHLGFLVMLEDEGDGRTAQSGSLVVKLQSESPIPDFAERALSPLSDPQAACSWEADADGADIYDAQGRALGRIRQQYLNLGGQMFVLENMVGLI
ncbi:MAG: hypothetical protein Q3966_05640 [Neisseria sp.]|nr:hypothetical protein [Neisseria sp.]